ncbi:MAG: hypothetical protein AAFQ54_06165 [Pseudomonadota bacterium]
MSDENFTPKEAPNYTNAFLAIMLPIAFFALWIIAGLFGFAWVILSAMGAEVAYRRYTGSRS